MRAEFVGTWQTYEMPTPEILQRVRSVHGEVGAVDPELHKQLDAVLLDPNKADYGGLRSRLLEAYTDLQAKHPKVAGALKGLIDELVAAGL